MLRFQKMCLLSEMIRIISNKVGIILGQCPCVLRSLLPRCPPLCLKVLFSCVCFVFCCLILFFVCVVCLGSRALCCLCCLRVFRSLLCVLFSVCLFFCNSVILLCCVCLVSTLLQNRFMVFFVVVPLFSCSRSLCLMSWLPSFAVVDHLCCFLFV